MIAGRRRADRARRASAGPSGRAGAPIRSAASSASSSELEGELDAVAARLRRDAHVRAEGASERLAEPLGGVDLRRGAAAGSIARGRDRRPRRGRRTRVRASRCAGPTRRARRPRARAGGARRGPAPSAGRGRGPRRASRPRSAASASSGSSSRRSRLEIATRRAADAAADVLARQPELLDEHGARARAASSGLRSSRAMFSISASSSDSASSCGRTSAGIGLEAGELRGTPAALTGDQLVGAARHAGARAPAAGRRAPCSDAASATSGSSLERAARLVAGSARSARPAGRAAPARRRRARSTGSPRARGPCRGSVQPRAATSLASSK